MNKELDDITWLQLNFQNRIVERTLKICGMTLNDIINKYKKGEYIMNKEFLIRFIKTLLINIIGGVILLKTGCYIQAHNEVSFFVCVALCILICIGVYFIQKDYTRPTDKEIAEVAIGGFIYALKRKANEIEENEYAEKVLNDTPIGETIKKYINNAE